MMLREGMLAHPECTAHSAKLHRSPVDRIACEGVERRCNLLRVPATSENSLKVGRGVSVVTAKACFHLRTCEVASHDQSSAAGAGEVKPGDEQERCRKRMSVWGGWLSRSNSALDLCAVCGNHRLAQSCDHLGGQMLANAMISDQRRRPAGAVEHEVAEREDASQSVPEPRVSTGSVHGEAIHQRRIGATTAEGQVAGL